MTEGSPDDVTIVDVAPDLAIPVVETPVEVVLARETISDWWHDWADRGGRYDGPVLALTEDSDVTDPASLQCYRTSYAHHQAVRHGVPAPRCRNIAGDLLPFTSDGWLALPQIGGLSDHAGHLTLVGGGCQPIDTTDGVLHPWTTAQREWDEEVGPTLPFIGRLYRCGITHRERGFLCTCDIVSVDATADELRARPAVPRPTEDWVDRWHLWRPESGLDELSAVPTISYLVPLVEHLAGRLW